MIFNGLVFSVGGRVLLVVRVILIFCEVSVLLILVVCII